MRPETLPPEAMAARRGRLIPASALALVLILALSAMTMTAHVSGPPRRSSATSPGALPTRGRLITSSTNYIGDPDIVAVDGRSAPFHRSGYLLFSTSDYTANVPTEWSSDLRHWRQLPDALPTPPPWADPTNANTKTWAPTVTRIANGYVMYVTARDEASSLQCVAVAFSRLPAGPYRSVSTKPLVCQKGLGGSIDPDVTQGPDGRRYLAWKSNGDAVGARTALWAQALTSNGLALEGIPHQLLEAGALWQDGNIEGPELASAPGAGWWLFYSGNQWDDPRGYATGLAYCPRLTATCTNVGTGPWLTGSYPSAIAPGGMDVFTTLSGQTELAVSTLSWIRWTDDDGDGHHWYGWNRNLLISPLSLGSAPLSGVARRHTHN